MGHPVVHFAVYYDDASRARQFYEQVFGWEFEPWGPPGYFKITTGSALGATGGALSKRAGPRGEGAPNAYRCTISVPDVEAAMAKIEAHGGQRASTTIEIPQVGSVAEFLDSEGNLACVMQYAEGMPWRVD